MAREKDIARLRELAGKIREIAELPVQKENRKLWTAVNDLHMIRPVLHVRDVPGDLLAYEDELTPRIEDPLLEKLEMDMLLRIYEWKHLRLDRVISPEIKCQCVIRDTGFGISRFKNFTYTSFGEKVVQNFQNLNRAEHFDPQIVTIDDLEKIKFPEVTYDEAATMRNFEAMQEIFDGILNVRLFGRAYFSHAPWDDLLTWMGISEGMEKFALEPEMMHAAVDRYIRAAIHQVRQYEDLGLISSNNAFENIGNNDPGFTEQLPPPSKSGIGMKLKDVWGANADQILTGVSPAMSEEFAFEYEKHYAELYGLYSYGCCERLDHKIASLKRYFKNLRKISASPFTNLEKAMEQTGGDYVVCFKPNSVYLTGASGPDLTYLREEVINACALARKYRANLVINMKTIITLEGDPTRLWKWCDMAREIVANY
jgi:hypothetical protein